MSRLCLQAEVFIKGKYMEIFQTFGQAPFFFFPERWFTSLGALSDLSTDQNCFGLSVELLCSVIMLNISQSVWHCHCDLLLSVTPPPPARLF